MTKARHILAVALIIVLMLPNAVLAGWVDDWTANAVVDQPSYYKGQSRGYLSAGGYSARWRNSSDYLVSVTPPKLKSGCGGIDVFAGGISFLNANYLVKQLQAILQNAPSVALDLALNVLCTQCAKSIKEFQSMMSRLNNLQLDSCKATQAIVAKTMSEASDYEEPELDGIVADYEQSSGISSFYTESNDKTVANDGKPSPATITGATSGCDAEFNVIFTTRANTYGKTSLLTNIGDRISLPAATTQLIAGLVGDVGINRDATSGYTTFAIPPCEENKTYNVNSSFDDAAYLRDYNDTSKCTQDSGPNANIKSYVTNMVTSIATKMETQSPLSPQESAFLNYISGDAYSYIKFGVQSGNKDVIIAQITPLLAKDMTRLILNDLYTKTEAMLAKAKEVAKKKAIPTVDATDSASGDSNECNAKMFAGVLSQSDKLMERVAVLRKELNDGYNAELAHMTAMLTNIRAFEDQKGKLESDIAKRFGVTGAFSR